MEQLTNSVNNAMKMMNAYAESTTSLDSSIPVELSNGEKIYMPSYQNVLNRVERAENTIATFTKGQGVVETDDDTYRNIKVETIAKSPEPITFENGVPVISSFTTNSNWFFEDFMFPKCVVKVNLKDYISDESDRILVKRVILDYTKTYNGTSVSEYYQNELKDKNYSYPALINKLESDEVKYYEDEEELSLPLANIQYNSEFKIVKIESEKDVNGIRRLYYYLDTVYYQQVDSNGMVISNAYQLSKYDYLRFNDSLYKITSIDPNAKKVTLDYYVGYETPAVGASFNYYEKPFKEKIAEIGIGFNEVNIVYFKGVNDNFNIVSYEWSTPINFITNDLKFNDTNMTLAEYYPAYVMDISQEWIAKAKESNILAYNGKTPNTPVLNADDMKVVQINTQLEATLDTEEYNNLVSNIVSTKSNINSLKKTISENKETLISSTDDSDIETLTNAIATDTKSYSTYTTQYNSLVEELYTLLNENGALSYTPKYHVRGFFPIPAPVYSDATLETGKQEVIGFEIMYRYIHTDNTGVELNTYTYSSNGEVTNAVFSDWNIIQSKMKEQVFDSNLGVYVWESVDEADGSKININQIDIPIRSGEKVEIKVRAISEAGYPSNPLKSAWSNTITISFPANLTAHDAITNIIDSAKDDMSAVVMQQTMSAAGLYTHLSDATNQYKHNAENIFITYQNKEAEESSTSTKETVALNVLVQDLYNRILELETKVAALEQP